ncbi:MAG: methyltransferase domain-containing protein [Candidatus Omnitrophica bacterium]|nr:methyltransferase domain-containing protein [Candidatus Omnitrophota bacterium]
MVDIKKQIKKSFSDSVKQYNKWAVVQKQAVQKLVYLLSHKGYENILDIGCGTGFVLEELQKQQIVFNKVTGIDVASGMIEYCRMMWPEEKFVCEDAEDFCPKEKYDLIISNFTFQWFDNIPFVIDKYLGALKEKGILALSFPIKGSLSELQKASVEKNDKPINLLKFPDLLEIAQDIKGEVMIRFIEPIKTLYDSSKDAIKAIKQIGASFGNGQAYSVKQMKNLLDSYEVLFKDKDSKIPATYNVAFLVLQKKQ